mmetsp:Transcript_34404/g.67798  ORF Transcript_34404/g.67798 Transcript_34404/m.67798 type:complete len:233 (-) Transcript_34404:860-1558(-)
MTTCGQVPLGAGKAKLSIRQPCPVLAIWKFPRFFSRSRTFALARWIEKHFIDLCDQLTIQCIKGTRLLHCTHLCLVGGNKPESCHLQALSAGLVGNSKDSGRIADQQTCLHCLFTKRGEVLYAILVSSPEESPPTFRDTDLCIKVVRLCLDDFCGTLAILTMQLPVLQRDCKRSAVGEPCCPAHCTCWPKLAMDPTPCLRGLRPCQNTRAGILRNFIVAAVHVVPTPSRAPY